MKSLSQCHQISRVSVGLTLAVAGMSTFAALASQDQPQSTAIREGSHRDVITTQNATSVATLLRAHKYSLTDAVKTAEAHCKGQAVAAMSRVTGDAPRDKQASDAVIDVIVLDASNKLQVVTVNLDGKVASMSEWTNANAQTMGWSSDRRIVKAETIMGHSVVAATGEKLGEIKNLAIDPIEGCVAYGVLSFNNDAGGKSDMLYAVPWSSLHERDKDTCVLNASKELVLKAPGFAAASWPDMNDSKWIESIHTYYNQPYYWERTRSGHPSDAPPSAADSMKHRPLVYKTSEVIGMNVVNPQGEKLGDIQDFAIEPGSGDIRYLVVSVGGFLGINERYIAVPWSAFGHDAKTNNLVLNVDKETLKKAPGFDKSNWPDFADRQWGADVHKFYQRKPYWIAPDGNAESNQQR